MNNGTGSAADEGYVCGISEKKLVQQGYSHYMTLSYNGFTHKIYKLGNSSYNIIKNENGSIVGISRSHQ